MYIPPDTISPTRNYTMICSVADCQKENHAKYPTRCWTHRGKQWAEPIAEPIAAPIVELVAELVSKVIAADEKKEVPELIPAEKNVVETDIVPPTSMSPNATSASSAPIIVEDGKSEPVKINCKPFFAACKSFLTENAVGKFYESFTMKKKGTEEYMNKPMRDMLLFRVEHEEGARAEVKGARRFYWTYNPKDAKAFADHVARKLKAECHEVFISPRTRFFFDIDLVLDEMDKNDLAEAMDYPLAEGCNELILLNAASENLAKVYFEAIKISLEDHGALDNIDHLDWMASTRNRALDDNGFKISIHLTTNLMLSHAACSAIATDIQEHAIIENANPLGIPESITNLVAEAIDPAQYRKHGSLGLPHGWKKGNESLVIKGYAVVGQSYFLTKSDMFCIEDVDMSNYDVKTVSSFTGVADGDFIKQALSHVDSIPDYSADVFDIEASYMKGSVMFLKRYKPSLCSFCKRTHDNDNTLKLFFNSELGFATWKCIRSKDKSRRFFALEQPVASADDDDIEAFATRKAKPVAVKPEEVKPVDAKPVAVKPKRSKPMFNMDDADGFQDDDFHDEDTEGSSSSMDPDAEEESVSQEHPGFNLEEALSNPEMHSPMLYELCKLIPSSWFRDTKNLWNLSRAIYQMPMTDPLIMKHTYAMILSHHGGEWFNQSRVITQYVAEGPSGKFPVMSLSKLKSIAGGSDAQGYKAWRATYDPEPIKVKKEKTTSDSETGSESNDKVESRLGGRWVEEAKKICDKTSISYDKLIDGMLKDIEVNGDYCMMDWRDEFIQPINRIVQDAEVPLADFIALAGNWVYKSAEEAAKFAAQPSILRSYYLPMAMSLCARRLMSVKTMAPSGLRAH
jgi:hypothetical protein